MAKKPEKIDNEHFSQIMGEEVDQEMLATIREAEQGAKELFGEKEEKPYWAKTIKKESLEAVKKAGYIIPEFMPRKNAVYHFKLKGAIKPVVSNKGNFNVVDIDNDGLRMSLKTNKSFEFGLESERERLGLSYKALESVEITYQKKDDGFVVVQINI